MLNAERKERILTALERTGVIKLTDLVEELNCSESTIRRDLIELEEDGLLERVHGGARLLKSNNQEPSMNEKSFKNIQSKYRIAQYAANLVNENECIYLDAGSTTIEMIPYLQDKNVIVVTNGLAHIEKLVQLQIESYLLGGKMKSRTKAVVGAVALDNIQNYHFDKAFIGTNAINTQFGYMTPDPEEAFLKRAANHLAAESFVLADHSKFSEANFAKMFELERATILTDYLPETIDKETFIQKTKIIEVEK
ncbi:DeoR family transcriptional regulator [Listeria floridensis FSL S10-1187]|uniref:DeoR family transcriptional regulator n=1 Tax=Listeria floridensis FSL S10-1187 TaxID=1265817 RepID=A0ABN0RDX2_9LIST|nr:DeoR/GlpR family DNA-binding transcription regulator [Listeria floridensis]EUJ30554.1 DeoR family transcriptional regulator [Listeria floridensis FSL S10-1187]